MLRSESAAELESTIGIGYLIMRNVTTVISILTDLSI